MKPFIIAAAILASSLAFAGFAHAAPTPAQSCEAAKLNAESKFAQCRLKADAAYAKTSDTAKRDAAYAKCEQKLVLAYSGAETKYPGACPTIADQSTVETFLETCTAKARDWTHGDLAALVLERLAASGQETCWAGGSLSSYPTPVACAGTGQDGEHATGAAVTYVDNGDGTVTDLNSGLMWAKKSDDNSTHDKDRTFRWAGVCSFTGTTFCTRDADCNSVGGVCQTQGTPTVFMWLDQLNATSFAGYSDWRLPDVRELSSLAHYGRTAPAVASELDSNCGLGSSGSPGCSVTSCSCTQPYLYWSSSSNASDPRLAWFVDFYDGHSHNNSKSNAYHVRAVRGGS